MDREKQLAANVIVYMAGTFGIKVLQFLLLIIVTHFLNQSEYGYYDLIVTSASLAMPIITLQINDAVFRYLLDSISQEERTRIISNAFLISVSGIILFNAILLVASLFYPIKSLPLILVYISLTVLFQFWQQAARGVGRSAIYAIAGVVYGGVLLLTQLVFVVWLGLKIDGLLISSALAGFIGILYIEGQIGIRRYIHWRSHSLKFSGQLVRYSVPLLPNTLNWWIMSLASRYFIIWFIGIEANGIYAVSAKFPTMLTAINSIFQLAWTESAIREFNSQDKELYYSKVYGLMVKFQWTVVMILLPVTYWAVQWMVDAQFAEAWKFIPPLYLAAAFNFFSSFYGTAYLSAKETAGNFTTTLWGSLVTLIFNFLLIPLWGLMGVAVASMLGSLAVWVIRIFHTRKYFKVRVDYRQTITLMGAVLLFSSVYYLHNYWLNAIMLVFSVVLFYSFNRDLVLQMFGFLKQRFPVTRLVTK